MDLHGGNIYKILRENRVNELIDYSSNINPFGVPETLKESIVNNFNLLTRYPDPDYIELKDRIACYNNLERDNIIVGNGAVEIIFLYMKAIKPKKILIVSPTFAEYERAIVKNSDSIINYFELKKSEDFILNTQTLKEELKNDYDVLVICNPNNPTGKLIKNNKMTEILKECNKNDTRLFIDEAFIEFVEGNLENSLVNMKEEINKENLFILRALTKFFAIPGLRFGYGICFDKKFKNKIKNIREPWTVNAFAELAGKTVFQDKNYIEKSEKWIREEKRYMYNKLSEINGIKTYKTETNFILVNLLSETSQIVREKMIKKGILVRDASNFKFLNNKFIRLAIKDRETNKFVVESLAEVITGSKK